MKKFTKLMTGLLCVTILTGSVVPMGMAAELQPKNTAMGSTLLQKVQVSNVARGHVYIPQGTKIQLELLDPISSKKSKEGNTFRLRTVDNLMINDVVVVRKGEEVTGYITKARKNGLLGRKGRLEFNIPYIKTVNGINVPVHGVVESKGKSDGGAVAVAMAVTLVGGLFMKGTNVYYQPGQMFEVQVSQDTDLNTTLANLAGEMDLTKPHGQVIQIFVK